MGGRASLRKTSFLCSFCFSSLPVGQFVDGHWCCFHCYRRVFQKPPTEELILPLLKPSKTKITIEDVSTNNDL